MEEHKEKEEYVCLATYMGAVTQTTCKCRSVVRILYSAFYIPQHFIFVRIIGGYSHA